MAVLRKDKMIKKTAIILLLVLAAQYAGRPQGAAPTGLAFADTRTEDGQPCPPECVSDSMEIVTWYPSPYNEYEELRLYPTQRDANYCDNDKIGLMYYDHGGTPSFPDNDKMMICKGTLLGWQEVGGGGMKVPNTTASCDTANSGMLAFDGVALKLCVNSSWQAIYSPKILGSLHTEYDCISIPGANVVSDSSGNKFCRMSASSCPSGWSPYLSWSETMNKTCSGRCWSDVSGWDSSQCSTGGHAWNNQGQESCLFGDTSCETYGRCYAEMLKIGCY